MDPKWDSGLEVDDAVDKWFSFIYDHHDIADEDQDDFVTNIQHINQCININCVDVTNSELTDSKDCYYDVANCSDPIPFGDDLEDINYNLNKSENNSHLAIKDGGPDLIENQNYAQVNSPEEIDNASSLLGSVYDTKTSGTSETISVDFNDSTINCQENNGIYVTSSAQGYDHCLQENKNVYDNGNLHNDFVSNQSNLNNIEFSDGVTTLSIYDQGNDELQNGNLSSPEKHHEEESNSSTKYDDTVKSVTIKISTDLDDPIFYSVNSSNESSNDNKNISQTLIGEHFGENFNQVNINSDYLNDTSSHTLFPNSVVPIRYESCETLPISEVSPILPNLDDIENNLESNTFGAISNTYKEESNNLELDKGLIEYSSGPYLVNDNDFDRNTPTSTFNGISNFPLSKTNKETNETDFNCHLNQFEKEYPSTEDILFSINNEGYCNDDYNNPNQDYLTQLDNFDPDDTRMENIDDDYINPTHNYMENLELEDQRFDSQVTLNVDETPSWVCISDVIMTDKYDPVIETEQLNLDKAKNDIELGSNHDLKFDNDEFKLSFKKDDISNPDVQNDNLTSNIEPEFINSRGAEQKRTITQSEDETPNSANESSNEESGLVGAVARVVRRSMRRMKRLRLSGRKKSSNDKTNESPVKNGVSEETDERRELPDNPKYGLPSVRSPAAAAILLPSLLAAFNPGSSEILDLISSSPRETLSNTVDNGSEDLDETIEVSISTSTISRENGNTSALPQDDFRIPRPNISISNRSDRNEDSSTTEGTQQSSSISGNTSSPNHQHEPDEPHNHPIHPIETSSNQSDSSQNLTESSSRYENPSDFLNASITSSSSSNWSEVYTNRLTRNQSPVRSSYELAQREDGLNQIQALPEPDNQRPVISSPVITGTQTTPRLNRTRQYRERALSEEERTRRENLVSRRRRMATRRRPPRRQQRRNSEHHQEELEERNWRHNYSGLLGALSVTVTTFNISRFAVLGARFGWPFIVQWLIVSVIMGLPLMSFHMSLGQYLQSGAISMWSISPIFKGVGISLLIAQSVIGVYCSVPIAWMFSYFRDSFITTHNIFRWADCRLVTCPNQSMYGNLSSVISYTIPKYFSMHILKRNENLDVMNGVGDLTFDQGFNTVLVWVITFFGICRGNRTYGVICYLAFLLPFLCYMIVCVYLSTYLMADEISQANNFSRFFMNSMSWMAAAREAFLVWGLHGVVLQQMSAFNKKNHPIHRDMIAVSLVTILVLIVAATTGNSCVSQLEKDHLYYKSSSFETTLNGQFLSNVEPVNLYDENLIYHYWKMEISNIREVLPNLSEVHSHHDNFYAGIRIRSPVKDSPNDYKDTERSGYMVLRFATELFPALLAINTAENISPFWSSLFYFALLLFGLAQQLAVWRCVSEAVVQLHPAALRSWQNLLSLFCCIFGCSLSLLLATSGGIHVLYFLDYFIGSAWWLMILHLIQIFAVLFIRGKPYGAQNIVTNLLGSSETCNGTWFPPCTSFAWNIIVPVGLLVLSISSFKAGNYREVFAWGVDSYWAEWSSQLSMCLQLTPILLVVIVAFLQTAKYLTKSNLDLFERISLLYRGRVRLERIPQTSVSTISGDLSEESGITVPPGVGESNEPTSSRPYSDPPPKYTPPPSYSTATSMRIAKLFNEGIRGSLRGSLRRLRKSLRMAHTSNNTNVESQDATTEQVPQNPIYLNIIENETNPPPDYSTLDPRRFRHNRRKGSHQSNDTPSISGSRNEATNINSSSRNTQSISRNTNSGSRNANSLSRNSQSLSRNAQSVSRNTNSLSRNTLPNQRSQNQSLSRNGSQSNISDALDMTSTETLHIEIGSSTSNDTDNEFANVERISHSEA